jgi:hypothetical protein
MTEGWVVYETQPDVINEKSMAYIVALEKNEVSHKWDLSTANNYHSHNPSSHAILPRYFPLDESSKMARKRWIILKDSAAQAELLAKINTVSTPEIDLVDDVEFDNISEIENSAEEDLNFPVHYMQAASTTPRMEHKHESEALNLDFISHKNMAAKKLFTHAAPSTKKLQQACENYLLYLNKHIISPIFIAHKKQTPNFSYSQKPWAIEKIMDEAINKDSLLYTLRKRNTRFDLAIMRYKILQICLDSIKMVPKASRSELFKSKYQKFKNIFDPTATIEHAVDLQAILAFKKAIGEKITRKTKSSLKPRL